jgi:GNAT superfamily N-acetyltransferase
MIFLRTMTVDDIPAGLSLCRYAGWNQLSRDWELFLRLNPHGCRVASDETGGVVGTATTLPYQDHFTWIGMVLVDPKKQRQGIGTQLLTDALQLTKKETTVKLDATPAGREVYLRLDFVDEYQITRMHLGVPSLNLLPPSIARSAHAGDFPDLLKLDREVFGADRKSLLEWNFKGAPQLAFVVEEQGKIKGFCLGRPGYNFHHIGPVVSQDLEAAIHVLSAALQNCAEQQIILDVVDHHGEWKKFVSSLGFVSMRPLTRMYRGTNAFPGIPEKQFAILGPEFG